MNWARVLLFGGFYSAALALVALFLLVEPDEETYLGRLSIFWFYKVPEQAEKVLQRVLPRRVFAFGAGVWDYIFNQRNPLLQLFYLVVVLGGYTCFVLYAHPQLPNRYLGEGHKYTSAAAVLVCLISFVAASVKGPGVINKDTVAFYDACYEPDRILYEPQRICETCNVKKPARSKHCRLCGHCVPRFDHHCPWVNTCVGQENLPYFLGFLALHMGMLWYGTVQVCFMFVSIIVENDLLNATFYSGRTGENFKATPELVAKYLIFRHGILFGLGILCIVMAAVLSGFLGYHLYLNAVNKTTNETYKWGEVRRIHKKLKLSYKAYIESQAGQGTEAEAISGTDQDVIARDANDASGTERPAGDNVSSTGKAEPQSPDSTQAGSVESDGGDSDGTAGRKGPRAPIDPGDMPINLYDKGIWRNLMEAWYPLTWRVPPKNGGGNSKKPSRRGKKKKAA